MAVGTRELYDARGRAVRPEGPGRSGGEGTVYRVQGDPSQAVKLYHPARVTSELTAKLEAMLRAPPAQARGHRSVAWVNGIVYDSPDGRTVAGFTMPWVDTATFHQAHRYYDARDRAKHFGRGFTWEHLLMCARNLAAAVCSVHEAGHRVGDLRETNVLVSSGTLVTLIDCDSFQIADPSGGVIYPTRVATGEYLPAELQGVDFSAGRADRLNADRFALAVLVFRFLMDGVHPFAARGELVRTAPTTEAKIRLGLFPYTGKHPATDLAPPPYAPPYETVPPKLRELFHRAFVAGHTRPSDRPGAAEWARALAAEAKAVKRCRRDPEHRYSRSLRSCPWCPRLESPPVRTAARSPVQIAVRPAVRMPNAPDVRKAWSRVKRVRELLPWVPLHVAAAAAGALAPVLAPAAVVALAVPILATAGTTKRTFKSLALVPWTFIRSAHRSAVRAFAVLLPLAGAAVIASVAVPWGLPAQLRLAGALSTLAVVADAARSRPDDLSPAVRRGGLSLLTALGPRKLQVALALGAVAAAAAARAGAALWWPLTP